MVDQVNFAACAELARLTEDGVDPQRVWVAVYNADSRPSPATLDCVTRLADALSAPEPRIMQQSALFTTNLQTFPPDARCPSPPTTQQRSSTTTSTSPASPTPSTSSSAQATSTAPNQHPICTSTPAASSVCPAPA